MNGLVELKRPICGLLSIFLPPAGLLIAYLASLLLATPPAREAVIAILIFSLGASVAGIAVAIAGLVRRERLRWLPVFGLVLSIAIGLSHFAA